jgi:hypothetical protein
VSAVLHDLVAESRHATICGRERILTGPESAIRARFVRDSFHSLSTGLPTAFFRHVAIATTAFRGRSKGGAAQRPEPWAAAGPCAEPAAGCEPLPRRIDWGPGSALAEPLARAAADLVWRRPDGVDRGARQFSQKNIAGEEARRLRSDDGRSVCVARAFRVHWLSSVSLRKQSKLPHCAHRASSAGVIARPATRLPVSMGVCRPWWKHVSFGPRDARAAQGAARADGRNLNTPHDLLSTMLESFPAPAAE